MTAPARGATGGLRFECTQCGQCCTRRGRYAFVYLDDAEVRALAERTSLTAKAFRWRYTFVDEMGWTQLAFAEDCCPFLDRATQRCTVYSARPTQCRTFPFWRELVDEHGWTRGAHELCEGVGLGEIQPADRVAASMAEMQAYDEADE